MFKDMILNLRLGIYEMNFKCKNRLLSFLTVVLLMISITGQHAMAVNAAELSNLSNCEEVFVGGMPFGIKLYTEGLLVVGFSDVECSSGSKTPAADAGIRIGDIITEINGKSITSADDFTTAVESTNGDLSVVYVRDNEKFETKIKPSLSNKDGKYKTGMWLRDSAAGIGTVTFTVPETLEFAGLGHGICDTETGEILPILRGYATDAKISGVKKGVPGTPGELRGYFTSGNCGVIMKNTSCGVFGIMNEEKINKLMPDKVKISNRKDVHTGKAHIYCTVEGDAPEKYEIVVTKVPGSTETSNFEIEITDTALLEKTGGIVQGMSGSPILQDGKLIGAVTHVLVNDPTRGYGIFIENMQKAGY